MARAVSTGFESACGQMLSETVKVLGKQRTGGGRGGVTEPEPEVVNNLKASVQPRSSLDARTLMGRMPSMTHMMYCRAEDATGTLLDIHKGDKVIETTADRAGRSFIILTEPEKYTDWHTGGWHHLEMELQEDVYYG